MLEWKDIPYKSGHYVRESSISIGKFLVHVHQMGKETNWFTSTQLYTCVDLKTDDLALAKANALIELETMLDVAHKAINEVEDTKWEAG